DELALEGGVEEVVPRLRCFELVFFQEVFVAGKAQRANVDASPVVVRVLHPPGIDEVPEIWRVVGFQETFRFGGDKRINRSAPPDVELRVGSLVAQTRQRFARRQAYELDGDFGIDLLEFGLHPFAPDDLRRTQQVKRSREFRLWAGGLAG